MARFADARCRASHHIRVMQVDWRAILIMYPCCLARPNTGNLALLALVWQRIILCNLCIGEGVRPSIRSQTRPQQPLHQLLDLHTSVACTLIRMKGKGRSRDKAEHLPGLSVVRLLEQRRRRLWHWYV
jgi:hypothetical protein